MRGIPQDRQNFFDEVVSSFTSEDRISVTAAKLETFLRKTQDIEVPAEERLRQLAIALEEQAFEKGWEGLRAIYEMAAQANPHDSYVFRSWGISAHDWAQDYRTSEFAERLNIALEAERSLTIALDLKADDSYAAYILGLVFYDHPARHEDFYSYKMKAIYWFRRAVEMDSDNAIAQLYVAHCYHDLASRGSIQQDWELAIEAYENVDQSLLEQDWPLWRALKCREQLAACYAWNGDEEEAIRRFSSFLDEIEALELDEHGMHVAVINLDELVDTLTRKLHNLDLIRRTRVQVKRYGFENFYKSLFLDSD